METKPTPKKPVATRKNNALSTFEGAYAVFVRSTKASMDAARACAEHAIRHFEKHGDLSQAQRFLDGMKEHSHNYVRRGAFVKWLAAHSPVTMEAGKFVKDKRETAMPFNLEAALKLPFWSFAPDNEELFVDNEDAFKRFLAACKFFQRDKVHCTPEVKALADQVKAIVEAAKAKAALAKASNEEAAAIPAAA